jgi:UTP--glucose-1-phosphate uridylyltransferase
MRADGASAAVVRNYQRLLEQVLKGATGIIHDDVIEPVGDIDTLHHIRENETYRTVGMKALGQLAVIRLNGGLGSSMGMPNAKSLLPIRGNLTFNDLMIQQLRHVNEATGQHIPLIHMTSFRTDEDIIHVMREADVINPDGIPSTFKQHRHLKIYADNYTVANEATDSLNWNPPGHGDIFAALLATGLADTLLSAGKRYIFVASSDNLGATILPEILGYLVHNHVPFLMETCQRMDTDKKGGHLAREKNTGQLILREVAQAPMRDGHISSDFSDITRYEHFNTNSLWFDLEHIAKMARLHDGCIPLPLIRNIKPINTQEPSSRHAIQIETAMGAAIGVFGGARALQVPRERVIPVKTNNDLLLLRSDWYDIAEGGHLVTTAECNGRPNPRIDLDTKYYGMIRDFTDRMIVPPSLRAAESFTVIGDWMFDRPIEIRGSVTLRGRPDTQNRVPDEISVLRDTTLDLTRV